MYIFQNYFVFNFKFRLFNILKKDGLYYLSFFSNEGLKFSIIPLGYYLKLREDFIVVYFLNDVSLCKNYYYYFKFMILS